MKSRLYNAGWKLMDILFPPCCAGCGDWGKRYCQICFNNTILISSDICQLCGEPLENHESPICHRCQTTKTFFTAARSWAKFEGPLKIAIHSLKYKRNMALGEIFASPLARVMEENDWKIDLITSVPQDSARRKERGYNQADLLARPLSSITKISYYEAALIKVKRTSPQVGLSRDQRIKNMENVFKANPDIVHGRRVLVVDDVFTTGSTLNACAKALLEAGAKQVFGITLARSPIM